LRVIYTVKNILFSSGGLALNQILNFVLRTIFIEVLGVQYLGINSLFANVLMILSLAELGVGQAITYSLYKPLANHDKEKVNDLMSLYKKVYFYIGIGVIILGSLLIPFLPLITNGANEVEHLYLIFILFVLNSSFTYFWGYKRTLIIADQKEYRLVPFTAIFQVMDISLRIVVLLITGNYLLFLITQIISKLIENIVINNYIDKQYDYLDFDNASGIESSEKISIIANVKAMLFHKVGSVAINGTDSIILSAFISVSIVGIYSNYLLIMTAVNMLLLLIFNSAGASLGNFIALENDDKKEEIFRILNFIGVWLFGWASITLFFTINTFIELWIGKQYLVSNVVLLILCINFYLTGIRVPLGVMKSSGGIYTQDKYMPLIQAAINLILSIMLVQAYGMLGVFMGTLASSLLVPQWNRPYIVYKYLFKRSCRSYFVNVLMYTSVLSFAGGIIALFLHYIELKTNWHSLLIMLSLSFVIINSIFWILFRKTKEYQGTLNYISALLPK
jgi:O-antigen/teichoic acid export membrane protein